MSKITRGYPKPNGFADHYPYEKWLAIIGEYEPKIFRQTQLEAGYPKSGISRLTMTLDFHGLDIQLDGIVTYKRAQTRVRMYEWVNVSVYLCM